MNYSSITEELLPRYIIIVKHIYNTNSNGITLSSQNNNCSVLFCHTANGSLQQHFIVTVLKLLTNKSSKAIIRNVIIIITYAIVLKKLIVALTY